MGDRASYGLRLATSRRADVRYAHFGSPFLFADVFWGADDARAFIESLEKGPWLDDVYGEAAIALCFKTKSVAIYTYQLDDVDKAVATRLMRALWPGWNVRFGSKLTDVTPTVGVDLVNKAILRAQRNAKSARAAALKWRDPLQDLGARFRSEPYDLYFAFSGVVTIDGTDRLSDVDVSALLFSGPKMLDVIERAPTVDEARRVLRAQRFAWGNARDEGVFIGAYHALIDRAAKRVVVSVKQSPLQEVELIANAHAFGVAWPKQWTFEVQAGGLDAHFARVGRAVPEILATSPSGTTANVFARHSRNAVVASLRHIRSLLLGADETKDEGAAFVARATDVVNAIVAQTDAAAQIHVAEGLEDGVPPKSALPIEERRRRYALAVQNAGWTKEDELASQAPTEQEENALDPPVPANAAALVRSAYFAWRDDKHATAWKAIEEALALDDRTDNAAAIAGRVCFALDRLDDAVRFSERAIALRDDDAEAWATLGLVAGKREAIDEELRCYRRAADAAPKPWIVNNLACALLGEAEKATDARRRRSFCEQALAASALSPQRTSSLHWADACAHSMMGLDADRAYACIAASIAAYKGNKTELRQRMLDDKQLTWLWEQKGRQLP